MRWRRCALLIADSGQEIVAEGFSRLKQISWIEDISWGWARFPFPSSLLGGLCKLNNCRKRLRHLTHNGPPIPGGQTKRFLSCRSVSKQPPCPGDFSRSTQKGSAQGEKEGEKETREKTAGKQRRAKPERTTHTRAGTGTGADEMHMSIYHLSKYDPSPPWAFG
ncbi:hypothetical protein V8C34DRAFT_288934 [Trichoderma compactum]